MKGVVGSDSSFSGGVAVVLVVLVVSVTVNYVG